MAHSGKTTNSSGWNAIFSWIKYALTGKRDETKAVSQSSVSASSLVELNARLESLEKIIAYGIFGDMKAESLDAPNVMIGGVPVSPSDHTHQVKINGTVKTIAKTGGTPVDLGTYLTQHQDISGKADISSVVDSASYNSSNHTIVFKHGSTQLFTLDAAAFVKDGMVDSVVISNGNLVITFNTDAGKQPISIALTDIFNPSNYYTKTEIEYALTGKQDSLPYDSAADQYGIDVDSSETVKLTRIVYGVTNSTVSSSTKSVSLMSAPNESGWGYFAAILFKNGNSYSGALQLKVSFSRINLTVERVYTVSDSRLKYIESGSAYLFLLDPAHVTEGKLVGEVNSEMSLIVNNAGTGYNFVSNKGNLGVIPAYPYQSRSSFNDTFYNVTQSFTNGIGGALIKRLTLGSNVVGLDWASQPETRWDFIDMTIRLCGAYKSEYSSSETVTFELYISDGNNSYVIANLAEMSNYLFLANDGLYHPFAFTLNYRMQYKEFLSRIGGQGKTLYLCFRFGATTSSSGKHQVVIDTVWTRAVFHGDHS